MRILKKFSVATIAICLGGVTIAASSSADARHMRDWRVGYQTGTVVVSSWAATRPYYAYQYGWDYAPGGPFVDYPYQNCRGAVCWY